MARAREVICTGLTPFSSSSLPLGNLKFRPGIDLGPLRSDLEYWCRDEGKSRVEPRYSGLGLKDIPHSKSKRKFNWKKKKTCWDQFQRLFLDKC